MVMVLEIRPVSPLPRPLATPIRVFALTSQFFRISLPDGTADLPPSIRILSLPLWRAVETEPPCPAFSFLRPMFPRQDGKPVGRFKSPLSGSHPNSP